MLERPLMLWVKLLVDDKVHPQSNMFATSEKFKATVSDSKLNTAVTALNEAHNAESAITIHIKQALVE